jgi:hypothetical protein
VLAPGQTATDTAVVANLGSRPVTLTIYATDAFNTADGAFGLLTAAEKPTGLGSWISLDARKVTVQPGKQVDVSFTLRVPDGATPGDHAAGIVASRTVEGVGANNAKIAVDERVGARVYLRVQGPLTPAMNVTGLSVSYPHPWYPIGGTAAAIGYRLTNAGNVRLNGTAVVHLTGPFGIALGAPQTVRISQLLPGSAIAGTVAVPGVIPLGALTAHLEAEVVGGTESQTVAVPTILASTTTPAIPWLIVGVLVVALVVTVLLLRRRRRRRNAAAQADPTPPDSRGGSKIHDEKAGGDEDSDAPSTKRVPVAAGRVAHGGSSAAAGSDGSDGSDGGDARGAVGDAPGPDGKE